MNEQQQTHWPTPAVTVLLNVTQAPMGRHLAHPLTQQPLCGVQGTCERSGEIAVDAFEPAAWLGCKDCGLVLGWLVGEGEEVPACLSALRQLLRDPAFGPQALAVHLLQHGGQGTTEMLQLLVEHAPVTLWQDALAIGTRGDHGTLIEAGSTGHLFPPGELVVLASTAVDGTTLHLTCLDVRAAVEQAQGAGPRLRCAITRDLGPYWDRALFHLQSLYP